jgi:hypothetical protein
MSGATDRSVRFRVKQNVSGTFGVRGPGRGKVNLTPVSPVTGSGPNVALAGFPPIVDETRLALVNWSHTENVRTFILLPLPFQVTE